MEGYRQTSINIDRIIDDYSKEHSKDYSYHKLHTFPDSCKMVQYNATTEEINEFENNIISIRREQSMLEFPGSVVL